MFTGLIDIVLFAGVAVFVAIKLFRALGSRDYDMSDEMKQAWEKRYGKACGVSAKPASETAEAAAEGKVIDLYPIEEKEEDVFEKNKERYGKEIATTIQEVQKHDKSFQPEEFLKGANKAFEIILESFSRGDKESLKPLLSRDVYQSFAKAITEREKEGKTQETTLIALLSSDIRNIILKRKTVTIDVEFISEQVNLVRDKQGEIVEGDPKYVEKIDDVWSFSRSSASADPTWQLVRTCAGAGAA